MIKVEGKRVYLEGSTEELMNDAVKAITGVAEAYFDLKVQNGDADNAYMKACDIALEILSKSTVAVGERLYEKEMELNED